MKNKLLLSIGVAVMAFGALAGVGYVKAQQQGSAGFLISPVRVELVTEKGESEQVTLTVENVTDLPTKARAIVNDFEPSDDETGQPRVLLDENASVQGNSFKTLVGPIDDIDLGPREKKEVPVDIVIPADASAGGYYGVIRFASSDTEGNSNVALSASVGTIFLVTVPGDLQESLDISELTGAKNDKAGKFFIGSGDFSVITRLVNNGNIHVKPYGSIIVTDSKGNTIDNINFNDQDPRDNVLPDTVRKFQNKLEGEYKYGKYTINANIGYGNGNGLISAKTTFWVIPVWMAVLALVAFIALIVGAILLYNKLKSTRKHKVKPRR